MLWNERCLESIKKEKKEIEQRYGIRIGQTEIYCSGCGKSWGYGKHTCQDIRFEALKEGKKGRTPIPGRVYDLNGSCAL
jgi:hypothetical protein